MPQPSTMLTIGQVSERTGVATSALRFYEERGLIESARTGTGQRRFERRELRRVSFVRVAQSVGLTLEEIKDALDSLPDSRVLTERDWKRLSESWRPRTDERIRTLKELRDRLDNCIGCGCLSLKVCALYNPDDEVAERGPGPRRLMERAAQAGRER